MRRFLSVLGIMGWLCFFASLVPAQSSRTETPYLLPQTIFVGDEGRLVVPLGQAYAGAAPFVPQAAASFPFIPDVEIISIELERRAGQGRLLIDFIPYAPGVLAFPPLEFPPESGLPAITGLEVHIASVLTPSDMALSEPASTLAVPGTSFLVYGSLALILVLLSLGIGGSVWGRLHFRELWERFRRRRLLRVMMKFLIRLRQECCLEKSGNPGRYLSLLSAQFREFLSQFSGINCRSLTAGEFLELPAGYPVHGAPAAAESSAGSFAEGAAGSSAESASGISAGQSAGKSAFSTEYSPVFLCLLFRSWDILRFSGRSIQMTDLFQALNETKRFVAALDSAERGLPLSKNLPDAALDAGAGA